MFNKKQENSSVSADNNYCRIPQIHVMPEVFLSAAAQNIKLKKKKKQDKFLAKDQTKTPIQKPAKKRLIHPAVLALVIVIIVGLGGIVVYLLTSQEEPTIVIGNKNAQSKNLNGNKNQNENTNKNMNKNINQNINQNVNTNSNVSIPPPPPPLLSQRTFPSYPTTTDSDDDYLTDVEEHLYGTGVNNIDEDGDKYLDGLELINLYSPKNKTPVKLIDSDMVNIYNNQEQGYSIFYPKGWTIRIMGKDKSAINFVSDTVEFVQVLVMDNSSHESIISWAKKQFSDLDVNNLERVGVGDNLGLKSPDGLTVYFINEDKLYSATYQIGTLRKLNFKATFQMMYNSLKLYSRAGAIDVPVEQWPTYTNNQLGIKFQHPASFNIAVVENNIIKIDDFSLQTIDNNEGKEINEWFWQTYNKDDNSDCQLRSSELKIGKLETHFITATEENGNKCNDNGYYGISSDKKKIIKLAIGSNPIQEMAQIVGTVELFVPESAVVN